MIPEEGRRRSDKPVPPSLNLVSLERRLQRTAERLENVATRLEEHTREAGEPGGTDT